jgi:hypothetical protein
MVNFPGTLGPAKAGPTIRPKAIIRAVAAKIAVLFILVPPYVG